MIEFIEDTAKQRCVCKTDKIKTDIIIQKSNDGFIFFEIKFTKKLHKNDKNNPSFSDMCSDLILRKFKF